MSHDSEWVLTSNLKHIVFQLCLSAAGGKYLSWVISDFYPINWIACTLWHQAALWVVIAFSSYRTDSLSYFDSQSGTFKPRIPKGPRRKMFKIILIFAFVFAILGLCDQIYL